MRTYILQVGLQEEEDGRWSAWVEALPGCAAWGETRQEALRAVREAAEAYILDMLEAGEVLPPGGVEIVEAPVVTVTV